MDWRERISVDPADCHGVACIRGTRMPAAVILDNLAAGPSAAEIVDGYPSRIKTDLEAALHSAAKIVRA